jgi:hypothetical protein
VDSIAPFPGTSKKDGEAVRENELAEIAKEEDKDNDKKNNIQVDQFRWIYEQLRYDRHRKTHFVLTKLSPLQRACSGFIAPSYYDIPAGMFSRNMP